MGSVKKNSMTIWTMQKKKGIKNNEPEKFNDDDESEGEVRHLLIDGETFEALDISLSPTAPDLSGNSRTPSL